MAIVGASIAVRAVVGWLRATPMFFPDEYTYAALGRSLAEGAGPTIRGGSVHLPALLQPLVTAPAWFVADIELAYRIVQTMGAVAMSVAAVPVFLLARRLGLAQPVALALAGLAVAGPALLYASWILSEPFAYPLMLTAALAGTAALSRPSRPAQLAFVGLAVLAAFARLQFAVLPLCFMAAIVLMGLRERRLRASLRQQVLPLGLFVVPVIALLAGGLERALGLYRGILGFHVDPLAILVWVGRDAMVLVYASGWILVPGALIGLALALARPRSRVELAFAALVVPLAIALFLEAGFIAANEAQRIEERYLFYLLPLFAICFGLYASRGWPLRTAHALVAGALVTLSARIPLAGYVAGDKSESPFLLAAAELERSLGSAGAGSLAAAVLAAVLSGAAVAASRRPRRATGLVLALALMASVAAWAGAARFDHRNAARVRAEYLPADRSWVDQAAHEPSLVLNPASEAGSATQELFWNRSVQRLLRLPGTDPIDGFRAPLLHFRRDGLLVSEGRRVTGDLLVDRDGATLRLRGAHVIRSSTRYDLWRTDGRARAALYALGRYFDGWLAPRGQITIWPANGRRLAGQLVMTLSARHASGIRLEREGVPTKLLWLGAGASRRVSLAVCSNGPYVLTFVAERFRLVGTRVVSVRSSDPIFRGDARACISSGDGDRPIKKAWARR
jgi:hypothetical protein